MVGMMLHQDGSRHQWVPPSWWDLIVTMDDADSTIYSAFFVEEEGTMSSFRGFREVIEEELSFVRFVPMVRDTAGGPGGFGDGRVRRERRGEDEDVLDPLPGTHRADDAADEAARLVTDDQHALQCVVLREEVGRERGVERCHLGVVPGLGLQGELDDVHGRILTQAGTRRRPLVRAASPFAP